MAHYSNFNGRLVTKHGVATHACFEIFVVSKFCDRVNIKILDVFFGEFR